jgi:3-deoxy-manno-octulosonate cytidylyltransferase (CMP-KDO synthetase)
MTSLMAPITREQASDPNLVKVVVSSNNFALYFSRSVIPFERRVESGEWRANVYGHIGLYAYTKDFLLKYAALEPTPLEMTESLEQLRVLEHGYRIKMVDVADRPLGVDTEEDLERAKRHLRDVE